MSHYTTFAKVFHVENDYSFKQQNKEMLIEYFTSLPHLKGKQLKIVWDSKLNCSCKCLPGFRVMSKASSSLLKTYLVPKKISSSSNIDDFLI